MCFRPHKTFPVALAGAVVIIVLSSSRPLTPLTSLTTLGPLTEASHPLSLPSSLFPIWYIRYMARYLLPGLVAAGVDAGWTCWTDGSYVSVAFLVAGGSWLAIWISVNLA